MANFMLNIFGAIQKKFVDMGDGTHAEMMAVVQRKADGTALDVLPVRLADSANADPIGDVTANPAANTLLARLKALLTGIVPANAALPTFIGTGVGYTAYATPTDLLTLRGSATKVVRVIGVRLLVNTTAAGLQTVQFIKRSTNNTGGTRTTPAGTPFDSADPAQTAEVSLYTAAPTLGTEVGKVAYQSILTAVSTAAPGIYNLSTPVGSQLVVSYTKPVVLRGVNEVLAISWGGAALPAGFTAAWEILWTESDT